MWGISVQNEPAAAQVWDHNKDIIFERVEPILSDPETAKFVWGVGFHWYSGDDSENLEKVHKAFPNKKLLSRQQRLKIQMGG